ncbi:MAG: TRAP transporter small permease, partial [Pseudomonadota bacterium]
MGHSQAQGGWFQRLEETLIAVILGAMTLITFANVIARYVFNSNVLWALEATVFLFGWLVLLGAAYAVKVSAHLGVDAIVNLFGPVGRKALGLFSGACCIAFAFLLLKGGYDYWAVFADLPPTEGRWFPSGFRDSFRSQSFYEVDDIPMLPFLSFLEGAINYDESYEKLPKVVPYLILPLSALLLFVRFIEATVRIWRGDIDRLVASHELEED